jgi:hypothetical protein
MHGTHAASHKNPDYDGLFSAKPVSSGIADQNRAPAVQLSEHLLSK